MNTEKFIEDGIIAVVLILTGFFVFFLAIYIGIAKLFKKLIPNKSNNNEENYLDFSNRDYRDSDS